MFFLGACASSTSLLSLGAGGWPARTHTRRYFECELYPGCTLSTHPPTHTPSMASWFPIFFPLKEPVYVPAGAAVEAHMWRCVGAHKVWYEWAVAAPAAGAIHNVSGRSYYVGL